MAAGDVTRGSRTSITMTNLNSLADGQAKPFGEIASSTYLDYNFHFNFPINSSASGGAYHLYLVESQDGSEWTDDIDPTDDASTNVAARISDAKHIARMDTTYNGTNRLNAIIHFNLGDYVRFPCTNFGFVLLNNSNQTTPSSGFDGDYQAISIATS